MVLLPVRLSYWSEFCFALGQRLRTILQHGDIGEKIQEAIAPQIMFSLLIGGRTFLISDAVVVSWLMLPAICLLSYWLARQAKKAAPGWAGLITESLVKTLLQLCQNAGMSFDQAEKVVPFVGSLGVFISLANLAALLGLAPPAKNPAFPVALALLTICYVIAMSIRLVGLRGFWAALVYPRAMLLPFKILDFLIKPISLALRLFGNVFGAYILMEFVSLIIPFVIPGILGIWFDLADGILQAVIFAYLATTYIGEIVENAAEAERERQGRLAAYE